MSALLRSGSTHQRSDDPATIKLRRRDITFLFRNLATLLQNGLPMARALTTLSKERSLRRYEPLLNDLRRRVEVGEAFSAALGRFPLTFSKIVTNQVRAGERAGTLPESLSRLSGQMGKYDDLRSQVMKQLSYPIVLICAGTAAVCFMLVFVIPVFKDTYDDLGIELPMITRFMIGLGHASATYGWIVPLAIAGAVLGLRKARKNPMIAFKLDRSLLQIPILGNLIRNIVVYQFIDVFANLLQSGFTVVEALSVSAQAVGNTAVASSLEALQKGVTRGERFSRELDKFADLFPPVVSQLVVIGEQTGNLPKATSDIRDHLEREIQRDTSILVGTIEPVLTISLAAMIGTILLAVYLPMFDMIGNTRG